MDWSELERRPNSQQSQQNASFAIPVKKVAVRKDQVRKLPDGTTIVVTSEPEGSQKGDRNVDIYH